jgi:hypothetical protein
MQLSQLGGSAVLSMELQSTVSDNVSDSIISIDRLTRPHWELFLLPTANEIRQKLQWLQLGNRDNIRRAWLYKCAIRATRKKLKLSSDGGDSGSKECKRGCGGAYGGDWRSLGLEGFCNLQSGGRVCVRALGRNLASVAVKMFSHLIQFIKEYYKFCTFNGIWKDNATINCINNTNRLIPIKFDGPYYTSMLYKSEHFLFKIM